MSEDRRIRREDIPPPKCALDISPEDFDAVAQPTPAKPDPVSVEREFLACLPWHDGEVCRSCAIYVNADHVVMVNDTAGPHSPGFEMAAHCRALGFVGGGEHVIKRLVQWGVSEDMAERAVHRVLRMMRAECGLPL